ncbi:MAG: hypothetical protein K2X27_03355, partial [Candidatus Obscuribacterales bacterium]|nr:hypothetical protein [Candidatus Obscuribacterales bacterium]
MKFGLSKDSKIAHKVLLLIAVPLIFQYAFVVVLAFLLQQSEHEVMRERHAREVISQANNIYTSFITLGARIAMSSKWGMDPEGTKIDAIV